MGIINLLSTGLFLILAGTKVHVAIAERAALSSISAPLLSKTETCFGKPVLVTNTDRTTRPSTPCFRAVRG